MLAARRTPGAPCRIFRASHPPCRGHDVQWRSANSAAAYGALASTEGGIFLATGDLAGLVVSATSVTDILYA